MTSLSPTTLAAANAWLTPFFDEETHAAVKEMLAGPSEDVEECFYKNLEFGTGGMRGIMGAGDNRLNAYTLGKATQGLCNYLKISFPEQAIKVAIAYDCRNNSKAFAEVVAAVFSANGINVYLFSDLRPTPELSFAIRHLNCQCGIVLTASHNPPEYNGYKVYWQDGGQIVPPQDGAIIRAIAAVNYSEVQFAKQEERIQILGAEIDAAFIASTLQQVAFGTAQASKDKVKIVFTSLHGTASTVVPQTFAQAGFSHVYSVPEQAVPDGNFPTVTSPNPEEPAALKMALALAENTRADIVIGTDPDCDRVGVAVRNTKGEMVLLNGNQAMVLMSAFLLEKWQKEGRINGKQFIASTVVSTPMLQKIAQHFGVQYKEGLTGFKWIAKMVEDFPALEYICGGEESFGFMVGTAVRDKDAVSASLLMCELVAHAKENETSVYEALLQLYVTHGCYKEHLISLTKKGIRGVEEIHQLMVQLRNQPPQEINGSPVLVLEDYSTGFALDTRTKEKYSLDLPKSNVLIFKTADGSKICVRPSGTEPKIKFYVSVQSHLESVERYPEIEAQLQHRINQIAQEFAF
jgi:phosphoglucomutase